MDNTPNGQYPDRHFPEGMSLTESPDGQNPDGDFLSGFYQSGVVCWGYVIKELSIGTLSCRATVLIRCNNCQSFIPTCGIFICKFIKGSIFIFYLWRWRRGNTLYWDHLTLHANAHPFLVQRFCFLDLVEIHSIASGFQFSLPDPVSHGEQNQDVLAYLCAYTAPTSPCRLCCCGV